MFLYECIRSQLFSNFEVYVENYDAFKLCSALFIQLQTKAGQ